MKPSQLQFEKQLNLDLRLKFSELLPDEITKVKHHFVMPSVSRRGLKNVQRLKHAKGLTVLILFRGINQSPLFTYSVCSNEDNFSRIVGQNEVYQRALTILKNEGLEGFQTIDNSINEKGEVVSDVSIKIANTITSQLNTKKDKKQPVVLPTAVSVLETLNASHEIEKVYYKHFNRQAVSCYPLNVHYQGLRWYGAVTFVTVVLKNGELLRGVAICQPTDNFSREQGRLFALQSIAKQSSKRLLTQVKNLNILEINQFMNDKGFV